MDVEAGEVHVVVLQGRLSRSLLDFATLKDRFGKAKASFVSVAQNLSTADPMGRLTLSLSMGFAALEREMIAARTRDQVVAARRRGTWAGGPVPTGYLLADGKLAVNEDEARVVRQIFMLCEAHWSIVRILDELNAAGTTTKTHRRRTKDGVLRVLKNPIYAGFTRHEAELFAGEQGRRCARGGGGAERGDRRGAVRRRWAGGGARGEGARAQAACGRVDAGPGARDRPADRGRHVRPPGGCGAGAGPQPGADQPDRRPDVSSSGDPGRRPCSPRRRRGGIR